MIFPSEFLAPTTEEVGYFECSTSRFAKWMIASFGSEWSERAVSGTSLASLVELVKPRAALSRYLLLPVAEWTVLLNDGPLGTDVGVLPMHAARDLGCQGVRAAAVSPTSDRYGATILEVFDPDSTNPQRRRRTVFAVDDGGKWGFGQSGDPLQFEDQSAYSRRRVRDRFTSAMLEQYLVQLGVPVNEAPDTTAGVLVEKRGVHETGKTL